MTIRARLAFALVVAVNLAVVVAAQSLGDAARKAEQDRARSKEAPAKVFTNKDLPDAPAVPPPSQPDPSSNGGSSNVITSAQPEDGRRRDERPRDVADLPPVPSSEGRIEVRKVGGLRGDCIETTLTLPIRAGQQKVPVTLQLRAVHEDRLPLVDTPLELEAHFAVGSLFLGKVSFERPHIVMAIGNPPAQPVLAASVDERQPLGLVSDVSAEVSLSALSQLETSSRIVGRLFGTEFELSAGQTRLIGEFSRRVRRHPGRGPAL